MGEMEREVLLDCGKELFVCEEEGGRESNRLSPPLKPSKSNPVEPPGSPPVGVTGVGVEQEPSRRAAFSSSCFFRHAALGFK